ncbi:MAG: 50S ribosomal protein L11 methyltransferase [Paludibacteraceae bacterium]
MKYLAIHFKFDNSEDYTADVFANYLGEINFESFVTTTEGLDGYIAEKNFDESMLIEMLSNFPFNVVIEYTKETLEDKNWNEEWEKHFFSPIIIEDQCIIHSSFHKDIPKLKYDIIINPKMAFGTGHHETTSLMIAEILKTDIAGKSVLDMGCGTSVLAILASMKGATDITAIDIDDWCVDNSLENIAMNKVSNIQVYLGDADLLGGKHFDIILANINRNILLNDMEKYADCLLSGGNLYMSGFYTEDIPLIESKANDLGFRMDYYQQKNKWAAVKTTKI